MYRVLRPGGMAIIISSCPMHVYLCGRLGGSIKWESVDVQRVTGDAGKSHYHIHTCHVPNPKPPVKESLLDKYWGKPAREAVATGWGKARWATAPVGVDAAAEKSVRPTNS
jgi:hypothetical protein